MGYIIFRQDKALHGEARGESFVVYTDWGDQRIELGWGHLHELEWIAQELRKYAVSAHIPVERK